MPELQVLIRVSEGVVQEIKMDPGVAVAVANDDDGSLSVHRLVEPGRMEIMEGTTLPVPMTHSVPRATYDMPEILSPSELDDMSLLELERYRDRWCHWVLNVARLLQGIGLILTEFAGDPGAKEYEWHTEFGKFQIAHPDSLVWRVSVDVANHPIAPEWLKLLQLTEGIDSGRVYVSALVPGEWLLGLLATIEEAKDLVAERNRTREMEQAALLRQLLTPWP